MCKNCRDIIRNRAITHYLNTHDIGPMDGSTRSIFETGVKFGELQTALFVEKAYLDNQALTSVNPMIGVLAAVFKVAPETVVLPDSEPYQQTAEDKFATQVMQELAHHLEQEGLALLYGVATPAHGDEYNSLRKVHELEPKQLATVN